jgi:tetratricopeptide (TPR) repeat protein
VLRETEGPRAALAVVEAYARDHWWHLPSQLGMASLQRESGDSALALTTARNAQRLDIRGAAAFDEAAKCEITLGKTSDALESQAVAVARAPRNPAYLDFFSAILRQLGRDSEAAAVHRKAAALVAAAGPRLL